MAGNDPRTISQFRRLVTSDDDLTLLRRFLTTTDATAFAELVHRHGPMVAGVCRRVLGSEFDSDDAFQATFLVLARRAGSVRKGESLGSWLHGVARFSAIRLRDQERRRRRHEANAKPVPQPDTDPDLLAALDGELDRLPARYREPVIACFLQARTQEETAQELGCSLSTLRRRLQFGLELLRRRLNSDTALLSVGAFGAAIASPTLLPARMVESTTSLVLAQMNPESPTLPASTLAEGVMTMMARSKLKTVLLVALVAVSLTAGGLAWQFATAEPPAVTDTKKAGKPGDPVPKAVPPPKEIAPKLDVIKPGDRLTIRGASISDSLKLKGDYIVEPSGKLPLLHHLGGRVKVDGLTLEEAEKVIILQLKTYLKDPEITLVRSMPIDADELEPRILKLEKEVKDLRAELAKLKQKTP